MQKFQADWVYPVSNDPIKNGIVVTEDDGSIREVISADAYSVDDIQVLHGTIVPGFVNTHCHLELSHMKGLMDTGTGLISFINDVVRKRNAADEIIAQAIRDAEDEMVRNGIVAVGDISNVMDTFTQKQLGRLRYYTFVEMFDFLQDKDAQSWFDQYFKVFESLEVPEGHRKSCVPHAPYSVSNSLFKLINAQNRGMRQTVSIHNQEMESENALFMRKSGGLPAFYEGFNISLGEFISTGRSSIYYALQNMDHTHRTLFVHNILTTAEEIRDAHTWSANVYWATCPNANLFIENRLPDYRAFIRHNARLTLGTDSLASNWQLSILEEMKTITRYQSYVSFEAMLQWATLNGAEALGFDDMLGSIESGKKPGLNLLDFDPEQEKLHDRVTVKKVI
jgi:cytosine/adenosine deaminase-related metal-dependent hydrolase